MRTITCEIDSETMTAMAETTGNEKLYAALGYLMSWNETFPLVHIYATTGPEITAIYRREAEGPVGYAIGAVWHGDHFGMHS